MQTKPNSWYVLLGFVFLIVVTFLFFSIASRTPDPIVVLEDDELEALTEPVVTVIDPVQGSKEASVTIVEFGDFACGPCAKLDTTLAQLYAMYPDDVRIVWKDAPNESLHPESLSAAIAARCADEQDLFWAYHNELFLRQNSLGTTTYLSIAEDLALDEDAFASCLENQDPLPRIQKTLEEAEALSLTATPTIFIGSERFVGAVEFDEIRERILAELR